MKVANYKKVLKAFQGKNLDQVVSGIKDLAATNDPWAVYALSYIPEIAKGQKVDTKANKEKFEFIEKLLVDTLYLAENLGKDDLQAFEELVKTSKIDNDDRSIYEHFLLADYYYAANVTEKENRNKANNHYDIVIQKLSGLSDSRQLQYAPLLVNVAWRKYEIWKRDNSQSVDFGSLDEIKNIFELAKKGASNEAKIGIFNIETFKHTEEAIQLESKVKQEKDKGKKADQKLIAQFEAKIDSHYKEAQTSIDKAFKLDPNHPITLNNQASVYSNAVTKEGSLKALKATSKLVHDDQFYVQRAKSIFHTAFHQYTRFMTAEFEELLIKRFCDNIRSKPKGFLSTNWDNYTNDDILKHHKTEAGNISIIAKDFIDALTVSAGKFIADKTFDPSKLENFVENIIETEWEKINEMIASPETKKEAEKNKELSGRLSKGENIELEDSRFTEFLKRSIEEKIKSSESNEAKRATSPEFNAGSIVATVKYSAPVMEARFHRAKSSLKKTVITDEDLSKGGEGLKHFMMESRVRSKQRPITEKSLTAIKLNNISDEQKHHTGDIKGLVEKEGYARAARTILKYAPQVLSSDTLKDNVISFVTKDSNKDKLKLLPQYRNLANLEEWIEDRLSGDTDEINEVRKLVGIIDGKKFDQIIVDSYYQIEIDKKANKLVSRMFKLADDLANDKIDTEDLADTIKNMVKKAGFTEFAPDANRILPTEIDKIIKNIESEKANISIFAGIKTAVLKLFNRKSAAVIRIEEAAKKAVKEAVKENVTDKKEFKVQNFSADIYKKQDQTISAGYEIAAKVLEKEHPEIFESKVFKEKLFEMTKNKKFGDKDLNEKELKSWINKGRKGQNYLTDMKMLGRTIIGKDEFNKLIVDLYYEDIINGSAEQLVDEMFGLAHEFYYKRLNASQLDKAIEKLVKENELLDYAPHARLRLIKAIKDIVVEVQSNKANLSAFEKFKNRLLEDFGSRSAGVAKIEKDAEAKLRAAIEKKVSKKGQPNFERFIKQFNESITDSVDKTGYGKVVKVLAKYSPEVFESKKFKESMLNFAMEYSKNKDLEKLGVKTGTNKELEDWIRYGKEGRNYIPDMIQLGSAINGNKFNQMVVNYYYEEQITEKANKLVDRMFDLAKDAAKGKLSDSKIDERIEKIVSKSEFKDMVKDSDKVLKGKLKEVLTEEINEKSKFQLFKSSNISILIKLKNSFLSAFNSKSKEVIAIEKAAEDKVRNIIKEEIREKFKPSVEDFKLSKRGQREANAALNAECSNIADMIISSMPEVFASDEFKDQMAKFVTNESNFAKVKSVKEYSLLDIKDLKERIANSEREDYIREMHNLGKIINQDAFNRIVVDSYYKNEIGKSANTLVESMLELANDLAVGQVDHDDVDKRVEKMVKKTGFKEFTPQAEIRMQKIVKDIVKNIELEKSSLSIFAKMKKGVLSLFGSKSAEVEIIEKFAKDQLLDAVERKVVKKGKPNVGKFTEKYNNSIPEGKREI
jgi:hypothetical protein